MPSGRANTVLIVDDDEDIREALSLVLSDSGYDTATATDGRAALEYLHTHHPGPGCIILDLMMPGMTGDEFRAEQMKDPEIADIPVVMLSASDEAVPAARDLGMSILRKPTDVDRLLEQVDSSTSTAR